MKHVFIAGFRTAISKYKNKMKPLLNRVFWLNCTQDFRPSLSNRNIFHVHWWNSL